MEDAVSDGEKERRRGGDGKASKDLTSRKKGAESRGRGF